jgi:hypothetical protein
MLPWRLGEMRFYAIPVKVGDSFVVTKKSFSAIIDGGKSRADIVGLVRDVP